MERIGESDGHRRCGWKTIFRLFGNTFQNSLSKSGRYMRIDERWMRRNIVNMLHKNSDGCIAAKRSNARHHLIENDAERIEIGAMIAM